MIIEHQLMAFAVTADRGPDNGGFNGPVHFASKGWAGTIAGVVWYRLLRLAESVPGFDVAPYRLTSGPVVLSADQARRLADAVDEGAALAGESPEYFATYLEPLRAGALTLYPGGLDVDAQLAATADCLH